MTPSGSISVGADAINLTNKILGETTEDLVDIMKELASEVGLLHISCIRMAANKSLDSSLLTSLTTFPNEWLRRYFYKQYVAIDPVLRHGRDATTPFDWEILVDNNANIVEFFADANRHNVGSNGFSIPVRNRKNTCGVVSYTNNLSRSDWEQFKNDNFLKLKHLSVLIDAAVATIGIKLPLPGEVNLSLREEQCLLWAARGKTYQDIRQILDLSLHSVRAHLDLARHKLHGTNLTHAVAVAVALGVIPEMTLRGSYG
jgi:DNA-binding CsgD family transcriptional regulator